MARRHVAPTLALALAAGLFVAAGCGADKDGRVGGVAGPAVAVTVVYAESPVLAGTWTDATCATVDAEGIATPIAGEVTLPAPAVVLEGRVMSEVAGTFDGDCHSEERPELPRVPGTLTVLPGAIASVELRVDPERDVYLPGSAVRLYWEVRDDFDNIVPGVPGTLVAPNPPAAVLIDAELRRYRLDHQGQHTFRVTLDAPAPPVTDSVTLLVDSEGPEVAITFPERGATLAGDGQPVVVTGTVRDLGSGVGRLDINGRQVAVAGDGSFSHAVNVQWGLNVLEIAAVDGVGNTTTLTPTFQYSTAYLPFVDANARGLKHDEGMLALLGQNFFDNGVRDHSRIDDIATLLEVILGGVDIESVLTGSLSQFNQTIPLADFNWTLGIDGLSWLELVLAGQLDITAEAVETTRLGGTSVVIDSREGGLDLDVMMGDAVDRALTIDIAVTLHASFDLRADLCSFLGCLSAVDAEVFGGAVATGGIALESFTLTVETDIAKAIDGPLEIDFRRFTFGIHNLDLTPIQDVVFSLGTVNLPGVGDQTLIFPLSSFIDLEGLSRAILDPIVDAVTALLPAILGPIVENAAGPLFANLFGALEIDTTMPIPPLLGDRGVDYSLDLYTDLSTVRFTDDGGKVGLSVGLWSEQDIDREPLGAILRGGCLMGLADELTWGWDPSVGIGVRTDVVNAAFFAAWWTGYLNGPLDLGALTGGGAALPIPIGDATLELSWLLPPIVNDCGKSISVQIGDLFVVLSGEIFGGEVEVGLYADLVLHAGFSSGPDGLSLEIGQIAFSDFEVVYLDEGSLGGLFDLRTLIEDGLPAIMGSMLAGQSFGPFTLPGTDLSDSIPGLPSGTMLQLGDLTVVHTDGHVVVGGDLQ